jgi:hypothetical protein
MRGKVASNNKNGKKDKTGKDRIAVYSCPGLPDSRSSALAARKSRSLGVFIFSRTFRKIEITESDNDPWEPKSEIRNSKSEAWI